MVLTVALIIGTVLFGIGLYGALSQTNLVMIMMGVELMLGASMLNLVAFFAIMLAKMPFMHGVRILGVNSGRRTN